MINIAQIQQLLRPGLKAITSVYDQAPLQCTEVFETHDSDKAMEIEVEMKMLGLGQIVEEGAPIPQDDMYQSYVTKYVNRYVGLSVTITRQAIMDNLYQSRFPMTMTTLKHSLLQTKETLAMSVFNNGFSPQFPIGDGQPFFSDQHPTAGGVQSNTSTPAQLNEGVLETACTQVQLFKDAAGLLCNTVPKKLLVPPQLQWQGTRLLKSAFRTETANNDISAIYENSAIPMGLRVNNYLASPNAYFVISDAPNGLKHYKREKFTLDSYADFATKNILVSALERYCFGVSNWRAAYGNQGA